MPILFCFYLFFDIKRERNTQTERERERIKRQALRWLDWIPNTFLFLSFTLRACGGISTMYAHAMFLLCLLCHSRLIRWEHGIHTYLSWVFFTYFMSTFIISPLRLSCVFFLWFGSLFRSSFPLSNGLGLNWFHIFVHSPLFDFGFSLHFLLLTSLRTYDQSINHSCG